MKNKEVEEKKKKRNKKNVTSSLELSPENVH